MFDERGGMWDIWKENKWSQYLNVMEFADILPIKAEFTTSWNKNPMIFHYDRGHLYEYADGTNKREFAYLHLQKRRMTVENIDKDNFYIKPDVFTKTVDKTIECTDSLGVSYAAQCKLKRILGSLYKGDEMVFHIRVAFRRLGMYIKGENWHIKYKLY